MLQKLLIVQNFYSKTLFQNQTLQDSLKDANSQIEILTEELKDMKLTQSSSKSVCDKSKDSRIGGYLEKVTMLFCFR